MKERDVVYPTKESAETTIEGYRKIYDEDMCERFCPIAGMDCQGDECVCWVDTLDTKYVSRPSELGWKVRGRIGCAHQSINRIAGYSDEA